MRRSCLATLVAAGSMLVLSASSALSGSYWSNANGKYPFGDPPYTPDFGYDPEITTGCWKWNWQQYQWDEHCPVYVHPKAFMYPRSYRAVLRARG